MGTRISLCILGCLGTHYVDHVDLKFIETCLGSNSQVLEQKATAIMPCLRTLFKFGIYINSARYFLYPNSRIREKGLVNLGFTQNSDKNFLFILTCRSSLDGTFGDQGYNSKIELLASMCKSFTQLSLTKRKERRGGVKVVHKVHLPIQS